MAWVPLSSIPGETRDVTVRFVVIGRYGADPRTAPVQLLCEVDECCRQFLVADETGSMKLVAGVQPRPIRSGDIFLMTQGEAVLDQEGKLHLAIGSGRLDLTGHLSCAFRLAPNLSSAVWSQQERGAREPAARLPVHAEAPAKKPLHTEAPKAGGGKLPSCFLCEGRHLVYECPRQKCGVVAESRSLLAMENNHQRKQAVFEILAAARLPTPVGHRWYQTNKRSALYMCFANEEDAEAVRGAKLALGDEEVKMARIMAPRPQQQPDVEGRAKRRRVEDRDALGDTAADGGPRCFLCDALGHRFPDCSLSPRSVIVKNCPGCDTDKLLCELRKHGAPSASRATWHGQVCYVPLVNVEESLRLTRASAAWKIKLNGTRCAVHQVRSNLASGSQYIDAASATASVRAELEVPGAETPGRRQNADDKCKCFLCGSADHGIAYCELSPRSVYVRGLVGSSPAEVMNMFRQHGAHPARANFHHQVCYVSFETEQDVDRVLECSKMRQLSCGPKQCSVFKVRTTVKSGLQVSQTQEPPEGTVTGSGAQARDLPVHPDSHDTGTKAPESGTCAAPQDCAPGVGGQAAEDTLDVEGVCRGEGGDATAGPDNSSALGVAGAGKKRPSRRTQQVTEGCIESKGYSKAVWGALDRRACFLCGSDEHELLACPDRKKGVLLCLDWGSGMEPHKLIRLNSAIWVFLGDLGLKAVRLKWYKRVCHLLMDSEDTARQLVNAGHRGVTIGGELFMVRFPRSDRLMKPKAPTACEDVRDSHLPCPVCFGTSATAEASPDSHILTNCPKRSRVLRVRCASLSKDAAGEEAASRAALLEAALAAGLTQPQDMCWGYKDFFITMASDADADAFVDLAVGEGVEIHGEMASIGRC